VTPDWGPWRVVDISAPLQRVLACPPGGVVANLAASHP